MFDHDFIRSLPVAQGDSPAPAPLKSVLALDFTHYIAGPLASMMLADLGATVIKIEPPDGDRFRAYPPHDAAAAAESAPYLWANRNKLGMTVNLRHPEGRRAIDALLNRADVLVENYATGVMDRLELGYQTVRERHPALVYCSISAYGRTGAFAHRPGFDSVVQGESGFADMNGYADRDGVRSASSIMDIGTALLASNGILAALFERQSTGVGRRLEISLYHSALLMTGYASMQTLCSGTTPGRHGNTSPDTCPTGVFACKDAKFFLHCGNTQIFQRLMAQVLQRQDLAERADYQTVAGRMADRGNLFTVLDQAFAQRTWHALKSAFEQARVPAGEVRDLKSALTSPESQAQRMIERIPHPTLGWVPNVRNPIRLDGHPPTSAQAAPTHGQHTAEILEKFAGYSQAGVQAALASGAFSTAALTRAA